MTLKTHHIYLKKSSAYIFKILLIIGLIAYINKSSFGQLPGNSLNLKADGNYISINDASDKSLNTDMTWEFWIYRKCENGGNSVEPISKGWCQIYWSYYISIQGNNGKLIFHKMNMGGGSNCNFPFVHYESSDGVVPFNTWTHIAVVMSGTSVQFYKNGQPITTLISGSPFVGIANSGRPVLIGAYQFAGGNYGATPIGNIDEVRIWHSARTASQIAAKYKSKLNGNEPNLVAYYKLDEKGSGNGITVVNSAKNSIIPNGTTIGSSTNLNFVNNQTIVNAVPNCNVQQKPSSGDAIILNGVNQNIDAGKFFNYQAFTIDMWIKPGATQTSYAVIADNNYTDTRSWVCQQDGNLTNAYYFGSHSSNGGTGSPRFYLTPNIWQHIALVQGLDSTKVYVNGVLIQSILRTAATINYDGTQFLRLGRWGGGGRYWNGSMDEVRMWDIALSQNQIRSRMCHKIKISDPLYQNLILYYNFDESSGNSVYDGSFNIKDGSVINSPLRMLSGAAIGDISTYTYGAKFLTLKISDSEYFKIDKIQGSPTGIHLYKINRAPSLRKGIKGLGPNKTYFGVFPFGDSIVKYRATYTYTDNPYVIQANEDSLKLYARMSNSDSNWINTFASLDIVVNTLAKLKNSRSEFILGSSGEPLQIPKSVIINDSSVREGNSGNKLLKIPIRLNDTAVYNSSVNYTTEDSTAKAGEDYIGKTGTVNFHVGQLTDTIRINIKGDTTVEPAEIFKVLLSNPVNISIADTIAIISIKNNDTLVLQKTIVVENDKMSEKLSFHISPNPAKDFINIVSSKTVNDVKITIKDLNGRKIYSSRENFNAGKELKINISSFAQKFLFVDIKSDDVNEQFKILLK